MLTALCVCKELLFTIKGIVHARYFCVHATIRIWQCIFSAIMIVNMSFFLTCLSCRLIVIRMLKFQWILNT